MGRINGYLDQNDGTLTLWLPGDKAEDRRLVRRIRQAFTDELNERFKDGDWAITDLLETGAKVAEFYDRKTREAQQP